MIRVFLRGGLGNQMFQYAAGLALVERNKDELILDATFLLDRWPRRNFTYRNYALDVFDLKPRFTLLSRAARALPLPGVWMGLDLLTIGIRNAIGTGKFVGEKSLKFDPAILENKGNVTLFGFWQDERYFREVERDVRGAFVFKDELNGEAAEIAKEMGEWDSISVHVRRGDYVKTAVVAKQMGGTDIDYYARAVELITKKAGRPKIFVFSDDVEWCRENLKFSQPVAFVPAEIGGRSGSTHMQLMSLSKHNVITNSTFSWWAAWLNRNPEKMVVAPKKWFADGTYAEIVPEAWTKI